MGKGDRRSLKGKRWKHSYGNSRKRKQHKRPAFVPKVKKEKKVKMPAQVEAMVAEAVMEKAPVMETVAVATEQVAVAKPAKVKKAPAKKKEPAAKKEAPKKKAPAAKKKSK